MNTTGVYDAAEAAMAFVSRLLTLGVRFEREVVARVCVPSRVLRQWNADASLRMMNPREGFGFSSLKVNCGSGHVVEFYAEPSSEMPLSASDVLEARLDREPWSGKLHAETRLALAEQILRSLATEHVIQSTAKALCESYFAVTK